MLYLLCYRYRQCNSNRADPAGAELIILNGTCGSGKSTVAEEIMKRYGFAVIDGDCMLQVLSAGWAAVKQNIIPTRLLTRIGREIDVLAALGYPIVLSHIILPKDWCRYKEIFLKRRLKYSHFLLKPDIDAAISRCITRTCHKSVTPEYWIRYFDESLLFNGSADVFTIDNTDLTVDETVMKIMETHQRI